MSAEHDICQEILEIMATYHEQEKRAYGVDTPGGLEHMGDVWALLRAVRGDQAGPGNAAKRARRRWRLQQGWR